tara:strand:+ start:274 stop:528 length:255 start_codon:yes stop_codon:yes gene_type:complete
METIIDYVMRLEKSKHSLPVMNALDVYTKRNIKDYLARPEAKFDKEYSKERQEIRKYIRKDDLATKKSGGVIDWGYLLNAADGF